MFNTAAVAAEGHRNVTYSLSADTDFTCADIADATSFGRPTAGLIDGLRAG